MNRVRTWDVDLQTWAGSLIGEPFRWGRTDCASIVIEAQHIMYGTYVFNVPKWKGKVKALRTLAEVKSIRAVLRKYADPVGRGFLQMGDVVLLKNGCDVLETDGLMLVVRDYALSTSPDEGVIRVPLEAIPKKATFWRVRERSIW
ncbi:hypothetical protein LCGC14_2871690, partial [marine sediment metagenome]